jgi:hypothetical protein
LADCRSTANISGLVSDRSPRRRRDGGEVGQEQAEATVLGDGREVGQRTPCRQVRRVLRPHSGLMKLYSPFLMQDHFSALGKVV